MEYKYLSQCKDFKLLADRYSTEQLDDFERAIQEYEDSGCTEEEFENQAYYGFSDVINWYEGTMTTGQLFDFVEPYEVPVTGEKPMKHIDWFSEIVTHLYGKQTKDFWSDGEMILCANKEQSDFLASLIEQLYKSQDEDVIVTTGYYDSEEDKQGCTVDDYTGMWYVTIS